MAGRGIGAQLSRTQRRIRERIGLMRMVGFSFSLLPTEVTVDGDRIGGLVMDRGVGGPDRFGHILRRQDAKGDLVEFAMAFKTVVTLDKEFDKPDDHQAEPEVVEAEVHGEGITGGMQGESGDTKAQEVQPQHNGKSNKDKEDGDGVWGLMLVEQGIHTPRRIPAFVFRRVDITASDIGAMAQSAPNDGREEDSDK